MDRFKIKVVMVICFILGSIAIFIPKVPFAFNYPGRLVMPVMIFLAVEGYFHTKSVRNYIKRMIIAGEIMLILNFIISLIFMGIKGGYSDIPKYIYVYIGIATIVSIVFLILNIKGKWLSDKALVPYIFIVSVCTRMILIKTGGSLSILTDNLFIALAGILILLNALDEAKENKVNRSVVKVLIIFAICILTSTVIIGPAFALIVYVFRNNKRMIITGLFVLSGLCIPGFSIKELLAYPQWMMFFGIIFILLYNKEEGLKIKKPFYYIYPLGIWIPFVIGNIIR